MDKIFQYLPDINLGYYKNIDKIYVLGDIHGDLNKFLSFLKSINIIKSFKYPKDYNAYNRSFNQITNDVNEYITFNNNYLAKLKNICIVQLGDITDGHLSCSTHNGNTFIVGKLYATTTGESFSNKQNTTYNADSGLREPAIVTGSSGTSYDKDTTNCNKVGLTLNGLKSDYKLMAESVKKYGGFYVGRYEASLSTATPTSAGTSGTMQSKSGVIPTAANNSYTNIWYGLYEKAKGYTVSENSVQSSMIWGSQYDAMLNWVKSSGSSDISKITDTTIGNHNGSGVVTTGNSTYNNDSINKIRDLGGNLSEWTLEALSNYGRVYRGGGYSSSKSPRYRDGSSPNGTGAYCGTRLTLYIK